ncbi:HD domain-containing protein [Clostridium akagii]|uniref:Ppx/GppA phosphatase family protein n=1 Tax=Clostridium akagii TaxID=91623 RepID=UPI00047BEE2D|nr:HD domain-containing protein [Clostridium akagii]
MGNIQRETVAALDLGANFFRMIIAEIGSDGEINVLDELQKNTSIGKDTFSKKRIGPDAIYEACSILNGFVRLMKDYGVKFYWSVSTSGIREADNREYVLEQIRVRTGIEIQVINTAQERYLVFKALRDRLENSEKIYNDGAMIVNIGSGGVEISLYNEGNLKFTEYIKIGSLRLREVLGPLENSTLNFPQVIGEFVESKIYTLRNYLESYKIKNFIGLGGGLKLLLKLYENDVSFITKDSLLDFSKKIKDMSTEKIRETFGINYTEAKLLLPSSIIIEIFFNMTEAEGIYVPHVSLRHGMLIDMLSNRLSPDKRKVFENDVISTVWHMGEKYSIDKEHAQIVKRLALKIFDCTKKVHRLGNEERLLLEISAILHDIGKFVNLNEHGYFCYSLIHNEEILGLSDKNLNIVANIVRYHDEEIPTAAHENYKRLTYSDKLTVSKLASILKLSEALNISKKDKFKEFDIRMDDKKVYFTVEAYNDITLEIWSFDNKAEFFEEVMGIKPVMNIIN